MMMIVDETGMPTDVHALQALVSRQNRVIQVLMDRIESTGVQQSEFSLFQVTLMLEDQVKARTAELHAALEHNQRVNESLRSLTDELRQSEAELLRHQAHLSELVAEQTRDLVRAKEVAEEASRAKSAFLATMSHELRTPMHGVLGMTDLALTTRLDAQQRGYLEIVQRSAHSLLKLINSMLDVVMLDSGKLVFERVEINLPELLAEAVRIYQPQSLDKGLDLCLQVSADFPVSIQGDPGRWRQIVTLLLDNAIKFTAQGRVQVELALEWRNQQRWCRLQVQDSGIGIAGEFHQSIFQPFSQVDSSSTRSFGGSGLGLPLAKMLVSRMSGEILLSSQPGEGSCFTVYVPLDREPAALHAHDAMADTLPQAVVGFDYLEALQELDVCDCVPVARELLLTAEQSFASAGLALEHNDVAAVVDWAEHLKHALLGLGAMPAAKLAMSIALQGKAGHLPLVHSLLNDLKREWQQLLPALSDYVVRASAVINSRKD
jgi:signal transduction histidine kinase